MPTPMPVQIVVDSAASLPPEMSGAPGLHVVPMRLQLGGRSYLDAVDLSPYRLLQAAARVRRAAQDLVPAAGDV